MNTDKLIEIDVAVSYALFAQGRLDATTYGTEPAVRAARKAEASKAQRGVFEAITPTETLIIMECLDGETRPVLWCPDRDWAREYLEHANRPETLTVWKVSREEPAPTDITLDFCEQWADELDTSVDSDDFAAALPEYVEAHYSEGAWALYGKANGRE